MAAHKREDIRSAKEGQPSKRCRNIIVFGAVAVLWILADIAAKQYFEGSYRPGEVVSEPILGLFRFNLVHNTGAAWGMFDQATGVLALMSVIVCIAIVGYFALQSKQGSIGEVLGLALVFAGGVGNAIGRFTVGYVVDFIEFAFIEFPVFNIADIGVTCGIILFIGSMLFSWIKEERIRKEAESLQAAALGDKGFKRADSEDAEDFAGPREGE